jgi:hypothetical protein
MPLIRSFRGDSLIFFDRNDLGQDMYHENFVQISDENLKDVTYLKDVLPRNAVVNLPFLIALGGLEELGWRGILQPKMERLISYFPSVLIVAILWSLWHLPLWFIEGTVQSEFPFWLYFVSSLVLTASFTTLYKFTNNLFLCILSHAWFNYCIGLALFIGNKNVLQLDMNWKVIVAFSIELIVSVILGKIYNNKKTRKQNAFIILQSKL